MANHIAARLHAPSPKRILALDVGGTRGIITPAFLERIEATLQAKAILNNNRYDFAGRRGLIV